MAASSSLSGSWGPSPRGRGHRRSTARGYSQGGSIPARAGSPALNKFEKLLERVHPRAGGVTTTDIPTGMHGVGPSPRGRGHRPNHPDQRAIIATGNSESDDVYQAQKLGARALLQKPYSIENLGRCVQEELGKGISIPGTSE